MADLEVIREEDSIHVIKETGTEVRYYIFDEAEIHLNNIMVLFPILLSNCFLLTM